MLKLPVTVQHACMLPGHYCDGWMQAQFEVTLASHEAQVQQERTLQLGHVSKGRVVWGSPYTRSSCLLRGVEPIRLHVEPIRLHVEFIRLHVEPIRLHVEFIRLHVEPITLHVEPIRLHVEFIRLHVEPIRPQTEASSLA